MTKIREFVDRRPVLITTVVVLIELIAFFNIHINLTSDDMVNGIIREALFGLLTLFFIYIAAGSSAIKFSTNGLGYAFKKSWWLLTIPLILCLFLVFVSVMGGRPLVSNLIFVIFLTILDALTVGIFEESMMRGLIFNALLCKQGGTKRGIYSAIIISSLIFGFVHVAPDLLTSFPNISLSDASQMVGKTIESGMLGFLLAAIYLRNHNLWSIALIHALNDFLMLLPINIFAIEHQNGYVQSSGVTSSGIVYYAMAILSIPFIVTAVKIINNTPIPQYGFFKERWSPISVIEKRNSKRL